MLMRYLLAPVVCFMLVGFIGAVDRPAYAAPVNKKATPVEILHHQSAQHHGTDATLSVSADKGSSSIKKAGKPKESTVAKKKKKSSKASVAKAKNKKKSSKAIAAKKKAATIHRVASAQEPATVAKHARELYDPWLFRNAPEQFRAVTGESGIDELTLKILESAYSYLGTPYRYGGTTPAGFDCSGFVRQVFTENGITLSRSSREQAHEGVPIPLSELKPGDLIFFNMNARNKRPIDHVGVYIGDGQFIHASSKRAGAITIDALESKTYLPKVVGARRIVAHSGADEAVID
jgi:cell wall-associated NlpC family hydrolase